MDIRQNPIAPNATPLTPQQQALAPPSAGPAAVAPVPPSLPQPIPSVVAISEAARSLSLRPADGGQKVEPGEDEVDFAAAQLELMLGLLKVYTPPPPPTPQELGQAVAAEVAAEREAQQQVQASVKGAVQGAPPPVQEVVTDAGAGERADDADAAARVVGSDAAGEQSRRAGDALATGEPTAAAADAAPSATAVPAADSRAQRYVPVAAEDAARQIDLRA